MYGVESCVNPAYRGSGIGGKLMEARFNVARQLNLRGMVAGSAIIDYYQVAQQVSPEDYVRGVAEGRFFDTNLSKQIRKGFRPAALIPNYVDDPGTLGWGVVIVWDNPDYNPVFTLPMPVHAPRYRLRYTPGMGRPGAGGIQPAL
jgi:ribosomal protein S18 acetylase RimI-like enzyme